MYDDMFIIFNTYILKVNVGCDQISAKIVKKETWNSDSSQQQLSCQRRQNCYPFTPSSH